MKKITLLLICLLALVQTASATFVVYKLNLSTTRTGSGIVSKDKTTGYVFIDLETAEILILQAVVKRAVFSFQYPDDYTIDQVNAGLNKDTTVLTLKGSYSGSLAFKGINTSFVAFSTPTRMPKTFKISGSIVKKEGDLVKLEEHTGTLTLDQWNMSPWNSIYEDLPTLEAGLRQKLIDEGFTEQSP